MLAVPAGSEGCVNEAPKHTREDDDERLAPTAEIGIASDTGTEDMIASQVLWDSSLAASRLDKPISAAARDHDREHDVEPDEKPSVPKGDPPADQEGPHGEETSRRADERGEELRRTHRNR